MYQEALILNLEIVDITAEYVVLYSADHDLKMRWPKRLIPEDHLIIGKTVKINFSEPGTSLDTPLSYQATRTHQSLERKTASLGTAVMEKEPKISQPKQEKTLEEIHRLLEKIINE